MAFKVIDQSGEPITLAEARQHLRVDTYGSPESHPDDNLILLQLAAAREWCEQYLGINVAQRTIELALDSFPTDEIELPGPVLSVESITYIDADGNEQTIDAGNYTLDNYSNPAWLLPAVDTVWPTTKAVVNAMKVRYLVGYSIPGESPEINPLPKSIRAAILLVLGHLYENRENTTDVKLEDIPLGATALLDFYRTRRGFA